MVDFNLNAQEAGYQQLPSKVNSGVDYGADMQEALLGVLGKVANVVLDKVVADDKAHIKAAGEKNTSDAMKALQTGVFNAAQEFSSAQQGTREDYTGLDLEGNVQNAWDEPQKIIDEAAGGRMTEDQLQRFTAATEKAGRGLDRIKAKAQQQGSSFNYNIGVTEVYQRVTEEFGVDAAAEAFTKLMGTQPLKFMTQEVIVAQQAARQKAAEKNVETVNSRATKFGLVKETGETDASFEGRVIQRETDYARRQDVVGKLTEANQRLASNREIMDPNLRKPLEAMYGAEAGNKVFEDLSTLLVNYNPNTATPEQKQSLQQQLMDYESGALRDARTLMTTNDSAYSATERSIKEQVSTFQEIIKGNNMEALVSGGNKLKAANALANMFKNVPNYGELAQMNRDLGVLIQKDALFASSFNQLVQSTTGNAIGKLLIAGDFPAYAAAPASAEDWLKFNSRVLEMARSNPQFAKVMSMNSIKALSAAVDPMTGKVRDINATVGLLNLYGSKEFLNSIYPNVRDELGSTRFQSISDDLTKQITDEMFKQLDRLPMISESLNNAKVGSNNAIVVDWTKDGNIVLNYEKDGGALVPLANQDRGEVNRARHTISAAIRANSHLTGSDNYPKTLANIMGKKGYNFYSRFITVDEYNRVEKLRLKEDKAK